MCKGNYGQIAIRLSIDKYSIFAVDVTPKPMKKNVKIRKQYTRVFGVVRKKGGPKTKKVVHGPPFLEKRWSKKGAQQCTKMAFLIQNRHFSIMWTTWTTFFTLFYI